MKCFFLLLMVSLPMLGRAQINESDTANLQVNFRMSGIYQEGNVELLSLRSSFILSTRVQEAFVIKTQFNFIYQEFSGFKADENIDMSNFIYLHPERQVYPYMIFFVSRNYRRKINQRVFYGGGVTYQLINKHNHNVKISGNITYEVSDFSASTYNVESYNGNPEIAVWRATSYFQGSHYLGNSKLRAYYEAYWQQAVEDEDNYRIKVDIGLECHLWKGLSLQALYSYMHENVVISGILQDDSIVTFGASYYLKKID